MKYLIPIFTLILLFSCGESDDPVTDNPPTDEDPIEPIATELRTFIFGHSLLVHEPPLIPTPSNETSVPHWMHFLAQDAGYQYAVSGQYGFLPQHADLPPIAQWGFDHVAPVWDSDNESFGDADFNTVLLTAGNFIQWQAATEPYFGLEPLTPVDATRDIINWVRNEEEGIQIYIYENWPDMAPYLSEFPPNVQELEDYYNYTSGEFHEWWLDYHDEVIAQTPNANVKMIPVGPILSDMLTSSDLGLAGIPIEELYEDDAPHGRATLYFLAGLITYSAMYGTPGPEGYSVPDIVHEDVRNNYTDIVDFIWLELNAFQFENGESRVW